MRRRELKVLVEVHGRQEGLVRASARLWDPACTASRLSCCAGSRSMAVRLSFVGGSAVGARRITALQVA